MVFYDEIKPLFIFLLALIVFDDAVFSTDRNIFLRSLIWLEYFSIIYLWGFQTVYMNMSSTTYK